MAKDPNENVPAKTGYKTPVEKGDEPPVSERTKAEQQAGAEAAQSQAASQKRAQYEAEHLDDPDRDTYAEPAPLNSEADVTDVGKLAEEMNKEHEEEDRRDAQRGQPAGINPGEVASRGFAPTGHPATGTYPETALVPDEKKFPQGTQDKRTYTKAERDAKERDKKE